MGNTRTEVHNQNSIGIEMCCMDPNLGVSTKTEENTIELVKYLMNKYGIPVSNVRTHYTISGNSKVCPNWSANGWARFNSFKNKLTAINNPTSTPSQSSDIVYRVKLANGEQIAAFKNLESAKNLAQINKCNVYRSSDNALIASYLPAQNPATKPINYRVKRKNGEQLGAFGSLDNAKALALKEKAIVYDTNNNIVISYVPEADLGYLNLNPHMQTWKVYAVDGPYTLSNAIASLSPAKYGGLSYKIYEKKAEDVYKIKTDSFGYVAIYAPRDNDSSITNLPKYGNAAASEPSVNVSVNSSYAKNGTATVLVNELRVRSNPSTSSAHVATYYKGETLNYFEVYETSDYVWVRYKSMSGLDRYVAAKNKATGEKYLSGVV